MPEFKILSIDGGGTRGIFVAKYMDYIQKQIGSQNPVQDYFGLIVGTSTGAIIALALALGISTSRIVDLYKNGSRSIFARSPRSLFRGIILSKYSNTRLTVALKDLFGERKLGDVKCGVCIPSIDIVNGKTIVFKSNHSAKYIEDYKMPVWQVAAASCAAPSFFPPFYDHGTSAYVDGGLWASNPSLVGIGEARSLGIPLENLKILSVGTGNPLLYKNRSRIRKFGLLGWGSSLIELTFGVQSQGVSNIAKYVCGDRFMRIEPNVLPARGFKLDDTNKLDDLQAMAIQKGKESFVAVKRIFFESKACETKDQ